MSSDRGTLEQAIAAGYLEAKNTKATEDLRVAWREHREEHKLADIRVIPRRKAADVLVDLSPTGLITAAMPFRYPELRRLSGPGDWYAIRHVAIDKARRAARELVRIARDEMG
jgi:hypothetical protein